MQLSSAEVKCATALGWHRAGRAATMPPAMEPVSITYLGVPICPDAEMVEADEHGARIATREPMPVGTEIEITMRGDARTARVVSVAELRDAGMRVVFAGPRGEPSTPPPAAAETREVKPRRKKKKPE